MKRQKLHNLIPLTEDGYATLEPDNIKYEVHERPEEYTLPMDATTRYDHLEMKREEEKNEGHDYEQLFWEPANEEKDLMAQISKLGLPFILAENIQYVCSYITKIE